MGCLGAVAKDISLDDPGFHQFLMRNKDVSQHRLFQEQGPGSLNQFMSSQSFKRPKPQPTFGLQRRPGTIKRSNSIQRQKSKKVYSICRSTSPGKAALGRSGSRMTDNEAHRYLSRPDKSLIKRSHSIRSSPERLKRLQKTRPGSLIIPRNRNRSLEMNDNNDSNKSKHGQKFNSDTNNNVNFLQKVMHMLSHGKGEASDSSTLSSVSMPVKGIKGILKPSSPCTISTSTIHGDEDSFNDIHCLNNSPCSTKSNKKVHFTDPGLDARDSTSERETVSANKPQTYFGNAKSINIAKAPTTRHLIRDPWCQLWPIYDPRLSMYFHDKKPKLAQYSPHGYETVSTSFCSNTAQPKQINKENNMDCFTNEEVTHFTKGGNMLPPSTQTATIKSVDKLGKNIINKSNTFCVSPTKKAQTKTETENLNIFQTSFNTNSQANLKTWKLPQRKLSAKFNTTDANEKKINGQGLHDKSGNATFSSTPFNKLFCSSANDEKGKIINLSQLKSLPFKKVTTPLGYESSPWVATKGVCTLQKQRQIIQWLKDLDRSAIHDHPA